MKTKILLKKWKIFSQQQYLHLRKTEITVCFFSAFVCKDTDDATSAQLQNHLKERKNIYKRYS